MDQDILQSILKEALEETTTEILSLLSPNRSREAKAFRQCPLPEKMPLFTWRGSSRRSTVGVEREMEQKLKGFTEAEKILKKMLLQRHVPAQRLLYKTLDTTPMPRTVKSFYALFRGKEGPP